jgi:hypothetical protein
LADRFTDAVTQAIEALEREDRASRVKRPWMLNFTSEETGIFLVPCDVEATRRIVSSMHCDAATEKPP